MLLFGLVSGCLYAGESNIVVVGFIKRESRLRMELLVMFRLSHAWHFQTPALLGLSPSLSYIELLMFEQSVFPQDKNNLE